MQFLDALFTDEHAKKLFGRSFLVVLYLSIQSGKRIRTNSNYEYDQGLPREVFHQFP
jgi:hypothetical protein